MINSLLAQYFIGTLSSYIVFQKTIPIHNATTNTEMYQFYPPYQQILKEKRLNYTLWTKS